MLLLSLLSQNLKLTRKSVFRIFQQADPLEVAVHHEECDDGAQAASLLKFCLQMKQLDVKVVFKFALDVLLVGFVVHVL